MYIAALNFSACRLGEKHNLIDGQRQIKRRTDGPAETNRQTETQRQTERERETGRKRERSKKKETDESRERVTDRRTGRAWEIDVSQDRRTCRSRKTEGQRQIKNDRRVGRHAGRQIETVRPGRHAYRLLKQSDRPDRSKETASQASRWRETGKQADIHTV